MAKKKASAQLQPQSWLPVQTDEAWTRLQVYPDAIRDPATQQAFESRARSLLVKSGLGNLRYLCTSTGVAFNADHDSKEALAANLLASPHRDGLLFLGTFLRPRKSVVVEFYDTALNPNDAAALQTEVAAHCTGAAETVKPFTKLVSLYRSNPSLLENIHYRYAWRKLPTFFSYSTTADVNEQSMDDLTSNVDSLVSALGRLRPGESYLEFGTSHYSQTATIFVLHRHFPPSVKADYRDTFRLQHDFSAVAFTVDYSTKTLAVKTGNRAVAETIRDWVSQTLHITLDDARSSLFSAYKPESVEAAFLGDYDESHGIDLIGISFRQSFGPNHSPISVEAARHSRSVREDLAWLKSTGVLRLRSLSDISRFRVRYESKEIDVELLSEKGGALRFRMNDSGLSDELTAKLRVAFEKVFLIPLDHSIDPSVLAMGPADIYQFLMGGIQEDQVQPYQSHSLAKLVQQSLLKPIEERIGRCTDQQCSAYGQPVTDEAITECSGCQGALRWQDSRRYEEDKKGIISYVRAKLQKATGWKMAASQFKLESHSFYRLSSPKHPEHTVCVFMNNRLNTAKIETFQRAMFPIIVVHPQGEHGLPVIDANGIAHIGLPHILAADDVREDWRKFRESCKVLIPRLLRMERERVLKTSRMSWDHIQAKLVGYNDRNFEVDVYNLLRSLFPFTVKWGGGNKPDGFCSLVYFPLNDLSKPEKWNWSYDAKFSDSTYPFGVGEFRQMFDYVRRLRASKPMMTQGNRYDAHVFITNAMEESAMQNAANFMRTQHRIGQDAPGFRLIFMRESFLVRLWERVRNEEIEFDKRGTYLPEFFVKAVEGGTTQGYRLIDATSADALADEVLEQDPVQDPVDTQKIKNDLKRQMESEIPKSPAKHPSDKNGTGKRGRRSTLATKAVD
ncbi:MAG: hypothetical protein KF774_00545 [Planctomyces sp.]|nr:hypothetical protein [Planctomyces sp.]